MTWKEIQKIAIKKILEHNLGKEYKKKLLFEIKEIEKQGAGDYWVDKYTRKVKFESNNNGLVLPFLLGLTHIDPIDAGIDHIVQYQPDFPDIDIDFRPLAKDPVKKYAAEQYGDKYVCSVGTWQTYGPKSALQDAVRALGEDLGEVMELTTNLPDDFDEMEKDQALIEFPEFKIYDELHPKVTDIAYRMVGLIKTQGRHAGGLIVSSVPIIDHIPLAYLGSKDNKHWTSAWSEGSSTQLSKMGFIKFDFLGLKTLDYIYDCVDFIKENKGVEIDWSHMDPEQDLAGYQVIDGERIPISFNDEVALKMAESLKTDSIFQFDTNLAKSILDKGGVKSFDDLVVYSALGRPGPLPMIDEYIKRRDGHVDWTSGEHPEITAILEKTFNVIVYQEQLTAIWQKIAGFTAPESEAARKAVAKKWVDKLAHIETKWIKGASKKLGEDSAKEWWERMVTFGRYCFNLSHCTAYIIIAYRCLWLKAHYPVEWWASVMCTCGSHKLPRYMSIAREERVNFGAIDCDFLSENFIAVEDKIIPGLLGVKGIGETITVPLIENNKDSYEDILEFVEVHGPNKALYERLIKLGAFDNKHKSRRAIWCWYMFNYVGGKAITFMKKAIRSVWCWTEDEIEEERERKTKEYFKEYPNRTKIPSNIVRWIPQTPRSEPNWELFKNLSPALDVILVNDKNFQKTLLGDDLIEEIEHLHKISRKIKLEVEHFEALFTDDFELEEILKFEEEYLGYHLHSIIDLYDNYGCDIESAKEDGVLECVIKSVSKNERFYRLNVTDGKTDANVMVWINDVNRNDPSLFKKGLGLRLAVYWKEQYKSFNVDNGTIVQILQKK